MVEDALLSIVFTANTTDRLNDIYELLESIKAQTYPNIEIIFVVDRSHELLKKAKDYQTENQITGLKILFNSQENGLSPRNLGVKEASGEIIAFVGDDVVLYHDWAEHMVMAYLEDSIIGITGPAIPLWENDSMSWFPEEFFFIIGCTAGAVLDRPREVKNAWGTNMSFRREAFKQCGLFAKESGAHKQSREEDNEFSARVRNKTGKRIVYWPGARVHHRVCKYHLSIPFIKERAYWIGYARRTAKKQFACDVEEKSDVHDQEHLEVTRIFKELFPTILAGFFARPGESWRKLKVTAFILFYFARGYYGQITSTRN